MVCVVHPCGCADTESRRVANPLARELLALQSSDWAFLDYGRKTGDYPFQRALDHSRALFEAIECGASTEPALRNLAPDLTPAPLLEP